MLIGQVSLEDLGVKPVGRVECCVICNVGVVGPYALKLGVLAG